MARKSIPEDQWQRRDRARKRFGGTLAGTFTITGGCGGMGGAQPLSVTLNGGA